MNRTKLIRGILVIGVFLTVMLLGAGPWAAKTEADPGWTSGNLEGMPYRYLIVPDDDGSYTILASYSLASVLEIQTATTAMNRAAETFVKRNSPFAAEIVFARPLAAEDFRAFVREVGIAPIENMARGVNSNGQIVTLGVPPVWAKDAKGHLLIGKTAAGNDPVDPNVLGRIAQGLRPTRFIGIFATSTTLDARTYANVQRDARVYVIDIMRQALIDTVRATGLSVPNEKIAVANPPLYAAMEKAGMVPKVTP